MELWRLVDIMPIFFAESEIVEAPILCLSQCIETINSKRQQLVAKFAHQVSRNLRIGAFRFCDKKHTVQIWIRCFDGSE